MSTQIQEQRVASFRGSNKKNWTHGSDDQLRPEQCAEAGFCLIGQNVLECFLCQLTLNTWVSGVDDPFRKHILGEPNCPWAAFLCIRRGKYPTTRRIIPANSAKKRVNALHTASRVDEALLQLWATAAVPSITTDDTSVGGLMAAARTGHSKWMEELRLQTFGEWWPYENDPDWQLTSLMMAQAGFIYFPSSGSNDGVLCIYCGVSLDAWEQNDDPVEEHTKRCAVCPFLVGILCAKEESAATTAATATGGRGTRSKAKPKASEPIAETEPPVEEMPVDSQVTQDVPARRTRRRAATTAKAVEHDNAPISEETAPRTRSRRKQPPTTTTRSSARTRKAAKVSEDSEYANKEQPAKMEDGEDVVMAYEIDHPVHAAEEEPVIAESSEKKAEPGNRIPEPVEQAPIAVYENNDAEPMDVVQAGHPADDSAKLVQDDYNVVAQLSASFTAAALAALPAADSSVTVEQFLRQIGAEQVDRIKQQCNKWIDDLRRQAVAKEQMLLQQFATTATSDAVNGDKGNSHLQLS